MTSIIFDALFVVAGALVGWGIAANRKKKEPKINIECDVRESMDQLDSMVRALDKMREASKPLAWFGLPDYVNIPSKERIIEMVEEEWRQLVNLGRPDPVIDLSKPFFVGQSRAISREEAAIYEARSIHEREDHFALYADLKPDDFDHE